MSRMYLKGNVVVNPLVNHWYVCMPMIAPLQYAMYLAYSQTRIMESFLQSPETHYAASMNPKLAGGPFVSYPKSRVPEVAAILEDIRADQKEIIEIATAFKELERTVASQKGQSLEPLYADIPDCLKGAVELVYDTFNRASIRLIEPVLYSRSPYTRQKQNVMLDLIFDDRRKFVLSTPVLPTETSVTLEHRFESSSYDALFRAKESASDVAALSEMLGVKADDVGKFKSMFTANRPIIPPCREYTEEGIRVRYFGHACILVQTSSISILTDPICSYSYKCDESRHTFEDLPETIDYVLISHAHLDHVLLETLIQIRHKIESIVVPRSGSATIVEPNLKLLLGRLGFERVIEIDAFETIGAGSGLIHGVPFLGEHHDLNISSKTGYVLDLSGEKFYIGADSANLENQVYEEIREKYGAIDNVFVGMECDGAPPSWFYGPLFNMPLERKDDLTRPGSASNCSQVKLTIKTLGASKVYIYAMGMETWASHILNIQYEEHAVQFREVDSLLKFCCEIGIESELLEGRRELIFGR